MEYRQYFRSEHVRSIFGDDGWDETICNICERRVKPSGFKRHIEKYHVTKSNNFKTFLSSIFDKWSKKLAQDRIEGHHSDTVT